MACVRTSEASQSSMSPKSTSACSPSDTTCENPIPRPAAQSRIEVASAPDCDTKASDPGCAAMCEKLAFRPACGASSPRQLGPRMRSRCGRAASSMACFVVPSSPAVSTMTARVPRAPRAATRPGTVAGGVQITARSGAEGSAAMSAWQGSPSRSVCFGFTAQRAPAKPARTFRHTVPPTLAGRALAPITATDRGSKRGSRLRIVMAGPFRTGR
jgi:hypothetical protein